MDRYKRYGVTYAIMKDVSCGVRVAEEQTSTGDWPNNADGDVMRRLVANGFDFSKPYDVDFQVDFEREIDGRAMHALKAQYPHARVEHIVLGPEDSPYIQVTVHSKLTYDFVIRMQDAITELVKPFGGWCDCWGVLHDPFEAERIIAPGELQNGATRH